MCNKSAPHVWQDTQLATSTNDSNQEGGGYIMPRKKSRPKADPTACVIYARFSSERQRDESIEDQVRVCSD